MKKSPGNPGCVQMMPSKSDTALFLGALRGTIADCKAFRKVRGKQRALHRPQLFIMGHFQMWKVWIEFISRILQLTRKFSCFCSMQSKITKPIQRSFRQMSLRIMINATCKEKRCYLSFVKKINENNFIEENILIDNI